MQFTYKIIKLLNYIFFNGDLAQSIPNFILKKLINYLYKKWNPKLQNAHQKSI